MYRILESENKFNLEEIVNGYIRIGYKPLGGVCVVLKAPFSTITYFQAIFLEGEFADAAIAQSGGK